MVYTTKEDEMKKDRVKIVTTAFILDLRGADRGVEFALAGVALVLCLLQFKAALTRWRACC